jgi:hypothetical protein
VVEGSLVGIIVLSVGTAVVSVGISVELVVGGMVVASVVGSVGAAVVSVEVAVLSVGAAVDGDTVVGVKSPEQVVFLVLKLPLVEVRKASKRKLVKSRVTLPFRTGSGVEIPDMHSKWLA